VSKLGLFRNMSRPCGVSRWVSPVNDRCEQRDRVIQRRSRPVLGSCNAGRRGFLAREADPSVVAALTNTIGRVRAAIARHERRDPRRADASVGRPEERSRRSAEGLRVAWRVHYDGER
jgi:hypothetical protein